MDITQEIRAIESAARGEEVRDSIVSALNKIANSGPPIPTVSDAGKFLKVDAQGAWALVTVPEAEGVGF